MKLSRSALVAVLSSSLLLTACTDDEGPTTTDPTTPASAGSDPADGTTSAGTGDGDDTSATSEAVTSETASTSPSTVTAAPAGQGVVTIEEAEEIADGLLKDAARSQTVSDRGALTIIDRTFRGPEVGANTAAVELRNLQSGTADYGTDPTVLAISREDENGVRLILAQSVPKTKVPELYLMTSQDQSDPWRIAWSAPMLPGTEVGTFDRRSEGTVVIKGQGDLSVEPDRLLKRLANFVAYPAEKKNPGILTNGYAPQVRHEARKQARAVDGFASFSQRHSLVDFSVRTLELEDGSAMTFGVLDRRSIFNVDSGKLLSTPPAFRALAGDSSVTDRAELRSYVFVAMHIPESGRPSVVAAREQLVSATGS